MRTPRRAKRDESHSRLSRHSPHESRARRGQDALGVAGRLQGDQRVPFQSRPRLWLAHEQHRQAARRGKGEVGQHATLNRHLDGAPRPHWMRCRDGRHRVQADFHGRKLNQPPKGENQ